MFVQGKILPCFRALFATIAKLIACPVFAGCGAAARLSAFFLLLFATIAKSVFFGQYASVAQGIERRFPKPCVGCSNHLGGTIKNCRSERFALTCFFVRETLWLRAMLVALLHSCTPVALLCDFATALGAHTAARLHAGCACMSAACCSLPRWQPLRAI